MKNLGNNIYVIVGSALSYIFTGITGYVTLSYFISTVKNDVKKTKGFIYKTEEISWVSQESLEQANEIVNKIGNKENIINKVDLAKKIEILKQEGIKREKF